MLFEKESIAPSDSFWLALRIELQSNWHTYWKNSGEAGCATSIEWHLPKELEVVEVKWPTPKRFIEESTVAFGYDESFVILVKLQAKQAISEKKVQATLRWVACNHGNCIPGESFVERALPISDSPVYSQENRSLFSSARGSLPSTDWRVLANNKTGCIDLKIYRPEGVEEIYDSATFIPVESELFSLREDLTLISDEEGYRVNLSKVPGKILEKPLEGVLLLTPTQKSEPLALYIEANVKDTSEESLVEPHSDFGGEVYLALMMAFFGGLLLNLMPCVLPVISLKILSIVKMAGESRKITLQHGIAFFLGVLFSFWILAALLLLLQAYGHAVGWGFQLQEPIFVASLAAILLILAMNLFGVLELGTKMAAWAGQTESQNSRQRGIVGSFFNGILATAVATPCTGPFLGSAIGFAVTLSPLPAMLIFTSLGVGMALPYLLLTAFPSLVKWLPRPGHWMVIFKQLMGFLMLATILWLVWVFGAQTDDVGVLFLLSALFMLALSCWVYGQLCSPMRSKRLRVCGVLFTILFALIGSYLLVISANITERERSEEKDLQSWLPFSEELFEQFRAEGRPIFIDFTAKWCVICQTNHFVLNLDNIEKLFEDLGVVKFKADWTRPNPVITKELRKFGRNGVPLYLLYAPSATSPLVLPQVLTPDIVTKYLEQIRDL